MDSKTGTTNSFTFTTSFRRDALAHRLRRCPSPYITAHWPLEPEVLAQSTALVLAAEQAAASQLRHHQLDKVIKPARQVRRHDVESVATVLAEPFLHVIG